MKLTRGYALEMGRGEPYRLPDGRTVVDCTVTLRPWRRTDIMLRAGLPMVRQLPMRHWPRGLLVLAKACVGWPGKFTVPFR